MDIKSHFKTYHLNFVDDLSSLIELQRMPRTYFVIDKNVYSLYEHILPHFPEERLFLLEAKEEKKTIQTALSICERMTTMPSKRNTCLVSIGGGVTQDITGFVATSLYRGIGWIFYPSTLLAACDSCIGGKSSLNYKGFKNLLGSFYPPDVINVCPQFFRTLALRDYESGLGEIVKFNAIAGGDKFISLEHDLEAILSHDYSKIVRYVQASLEYKKKFIEKDEFDCGIRVLLNFAHTFGHAYEVCSQYVIPHGTAVALGMVTANYISVERGWLDKVYADRIEVVCCKILRHIELRAEWFSIEKLLTAIHKDKKQIGNSITAVLMESEGSLRLVHDVKAEEIRKAVEHILTLLG